MSHITSSPCYLYSELIRRKKHKKRKQCNTVMIFSMNKFSRNGIILLHEIQIFRWMPLEQQMSCIHSKLIKEDCRYFITDPLINCQHLILFCNIQYTPDHNEWRMVKGSKKNLKIRSFKIAPLGFIGVVKFIRCHLHSRVMFGMMARKKFSLNFRNHVSWSDETKICFYSYEHHQHVWWEWGLHARKSFCRISWWMTDVLGLFLGSCEDW